MSATDTDPIRQEFEKWHASAFPGETGSGKEYAWQGYKAAASRPITVTDEMVLRGAWAPRNAFCKQAGLQPFDPRQKPDINEIEQARLIISAALNGIGKEGRGEERV